MKDKVIFLVGPTAIGKTDIGIRLAQRINAEIISCDSMQIYKGMDIITSKPTVALREKVKHHLINMVFPKKEYDVSRYRIQALRKIKEIFKKGKVPLFVGGSGLYMSAVLYGLFTQKSKNKEIRESLYKEAKMQGKESLFNRLKKIDPQACVKIHPHDLRRIIRALEVYEETGIPISELQRSRKGIIDDYGVRIIGLSMDRAALYNKIDRRVELMFEKGLIEEVKNLLRLSLSPTATMSIGIREIKAYLDGERSLEEAKRIIKRNTQYYAKKQLTWFKKDKNITWVKIKVLETPQEVANRIWKRLYSSP